jgi:hypothetical protein
MNGLCGMISVNDGIGDDSFGDSSYGMPIGKHYYMDNVPSDYGCEFGNEFGTEGFPEEFLGGPITFGGEEDE